MRKVLWTSEEAAQATGGRNTCDWISYGVSIDTRTLKNGDFFIALSDKRDGHDFVGEAFEKGAAAALVSRIPNNITFNRPMLLVDDVNLALKEMTVFARNRFKGKVIAITGSVGKTSSKDMLAIVLSKFGKVCKSQKSFNNHIGVPLTIVQSHSDSDFLIVEIGMSNKKEIAPLSLLARPNVAMITDVSEAHLSSFKNVGEIAKEKSDICMGLSKEGYCIFSRDSRSNRKLSKYIENFGIRSASFGVNKASTYRLDQTIIKDNKTCAKGILRSGAEFFFKVNSPGTHHAKNAIGIVAVLEALALDVTQGIFELSNWFPASGRGMITNIQCDKKYLAGSFTVIDETYNANPASVIASLNVLANFSRGDHETNDLTPGRKIAILGDMLELGHDANKKHFELAEMFDFEEIDLIHCIGSCMKYFYKNLPTVKRGQWVERVEDFSGVITNFVKDQDIIMLKASNGVGLNLILKKLQAMGKAD